MLLYALHTNLIIMYHTIYGMGYINHLNLFKTDTKRAELSVCTIEVEINI